MFVPDKSKRDKAKSDNSQTEDSKELKTLHPSTLHEQISQRAYEIYQTAGHVDGRDQQDWFKAEQELSRRESTGSGVHK